MCAQCAVCMYGIYGACLKWMLPELSFSDRWSRGTKLWERDCPGLFFRPPGLSPYMWREERRVQGLDYKVSGWPNKRAWEQIVEIWPILLEFGPINDLLLFVTGRRWCRSLAKVTKRVKIEKSNLFFVTPKTISVIPYPYNFLVSYRLSLKLFCQLSLIPKTPNRASLHFRTQWVFPGTHGDGLLER